jgi:hypothetical protein
MVVTQQEIDVFRAVLANHTEYHDALRALDIIAESDGDLTEAYPFLLPSGERGDQDDLEKLIEKCYAKCRGQLSKIDFTKLTHDVVEEAYPIVLIWASQEGVSLGIAVIILFALYKQIKSRSPQKPPNDKEN